jgi:hypothetical protein
LLFTEDQRSKYDDIRNLDYDYAHSKITKMLAIYKNDRGTGQKLKIVMDVCLSCEICQTMKQTRKVRSILSD